MIFSENRFPLFGIMRYARLTAYSVSAPGTTPPANPSEEIEVKEIAPTGKLRVAPAGR
jgi:hypothetical protein